MSKYKVLLSTNGHATGDIVELTPEQAANYNGGEPTPRVELVAEAAEAGEASPEKTQEELDAEAKAKEGTDPVAGSGDDENKNTADAGEGAGEGAGSDAAAGAGEGGDDAGK